MVPKGIVQWRWKMSDTTEICILGESFRFRSEYGEAYVQDLAAYVERIVEQTEAASRRASTQRIAVRSALAIANDFFELQRIVEGKDQDARQRLANMIEASDALLEEY